MKKHPSQATSRDQLKQITMITIRYRSGSNYSDSIRTGRRSTILDRRQAISEITKASSPPSPSPDSTPFLALG